MAGKKKSSAHLQSAVFPTHKGWNEIIKAITGWLQIVALIVLVVESILLYALYKSTEADPLRIWYVVAMLIFFTLIVLALVFDRYTQTTKREQKVNAIINNAQEQLIERIGYKVAYSYAKIEMLDLEGRCKLTRGWEGIKVFGDITVPYISGLVWFTTPGSEILTDPYLVEPINFNKSVELIKKNFENDKSRCDFQVKTGSPLTKKDPELSFEVEAIISKAFLTTKEEVVESYKNDAIKYESFGLEAEIPTDKLEIELIFPQGYVIDSFPGVFIGRSEFIHEPELQRVASNLQRFAKGIRFTVNDPLMGFRYFVHWMPPSKMIVDTLRKVKLS
jgi:hypothetical protein